MIERSAAGMLQSIRPVILVYKFGKRRRPAMRAFSASYPMRKPLQRDLDGDFEFVAFRVFPREMSGSNEGTQDREDRPTVARLR